MFLSDIDLFTVLRRKSNVHFMHEIQSIAFQNYVYFMGGFMYLFIVLWKIYALEIYICEKSKKIFLNLYSIDILLCAFLDLSENK